MFIGLHAKKRAGKDTLAALIAERLSFGSIAFADPLYSAIRAMFPGIPQPCWDDRNLRVPFLGRSVNELLQSLGTGWGRGCVAESVWVDAADRAARGMLRDDTGMRGIVFRDVRYDNEAEYIIANGGKVICIESNRGVVINSHSSEMGIDRRFIHATIHNDGTVYDMWKEFIDLNLPI